MQSNQPKPSLDTVEWVDLSAHGALLSVLRFPDKQTRVVLTGVKDGSPSWRWAEQNGFFASPSRLSLYTLDGKISLKKVLDHFKEGKRVSIPRNQVVRMVSQDNIKSQQTKIELRSVRVLGLNYLGQQVHEGVAGRFVRPEDGSQPINERNSIPALFLRGETPEARALCADGLVESMVRGEVLRSSDLRHFAGVVYGLASSMDPHDVRLRGIQEAVEAGMQRRLEKTAVGADREAFDWAVALTERQPPFIFRTSSSVENQQYSTPLPLAVAAQHMLGNTAGKTVLEPTIGNGSLVSILPSETEITGYEIDQARVDQVNLLRENMVVNHGDFTRVDTETDPAKFDIVVANPPFGGLAPNQDIKGLRVSRLDHLILMKSLEARKQEGRSVYIIAADRENVIDKNAGKISGGSKNLFNWLADHYELEGVTEVDGRLYEKQGAGYPVRLVVVGKARTQAEAIKARQTKAFRIGETVPVLRSWDEVWDFASLHTPQVEAPTQEHERGENSYQAPYVSLSGIGESTAMIPRNMLSSVGRALDELEEEYGTVDEFVSNSLQMTITDMSAAFSPEQVDAIALAIARVVEGRGFIVGDQTGLGKGRQLAAMARYAAITQRQIIFLTEKPNLFSDLWRDIKDICVDMDPKQVFKPLILNDGVSIRDENNQVVFPPTRKETVKKLIDDNTKPSDAGYTITFATYSQFNRELAKSPKSGWLGNAAEGSLMLLDESHNAAGASNTAENIAAAVEKSWGCVYSSATFAKNAKNMSAYSKVFPPTVSTTDLPDILIAGGEPLQEILAANLAEDGSMIRREHDLSNMSFETIHDQMHYDRNRELSDQLSEILLGMSYMAGDVKKKCQQLNTEMKKRMQGLGSEQRKGSRMGASSVNFGSRLYNILRQFQLAIKVDVTVESAIKSLESGRKPVIVTEQTMESLLAETLLGHDADDEVEGDDIKISSDVRLDPLTFRDVLYRVLDKVDTIIERNDYGTVTRTTAIEKAANEDEARAWEASKKFIRNLIDQFPDLPVSPLDSIRERIEAAGFTCGEISGRKMLVMTSPDGGIVVKARPDDRLKTIHAFNNGACDAVILTRAGSTGISLHASEKFEDRSQRVLIELQIVNNVAERIQFFGRVNRKGQVSAPIIYSISSGLPSEMRVLAMQNSKLRKLSANTQSNRENIVESKDVPDLLNPLGNEVVFRFLESNPSVASKLDINISGDDADITDDIHFVNRLTGRIALLRIADQEEVLDLITTEFNSTLSDLDKRGENPFKQSENNWGARVVARELFDGADNPNASVFERPVYLSSLEWEEFVEPMAWDLVEKATLNGISELLSDGRVSLVDGKTVNGIPMACTDLLDDAINEAFDQVIKDTLPNVLDEKKGITTLHDAINAKEPNPVKSAVSRRDFLRKAIRDLRPGRMVNFVGDNGESQSGLVVKLGLPEFDRHIHLLGQYQVFLAVPGEKKPQVHSIYSLMKNDFMKHPYFRDEYQNNWKAIEDLFTSAPSGKLLRKRLVLDGNLFRAAQVAAEMNIGRSGIYIDDQGNRQRAIILRSGTDIKTVKESSPRVPTVEMAVELLTTVHRVTLINLPVDLRNDAVRIRGLDQRFSEFSLSAPGSKQTGGKYYLDQSLLDITGEFAGNRAAMTVRIPAAKLRDVLTEIYRISGGLYAPAALRDSVNAMQKKADEVVKPAPGAMGMVA